MNIQMAFKIAYRALGRNPLRSGLTMLGIIIGVAAVIIMVSVGQGAKSMIEQEIASMGTNIIFIGAGSLSTGGQRMGLGSVQTLIPEDVEAILNEIPGILHATPGVPSGGQAVYGNQNWRTSILGVAPSYFIIRDWQLTEGSFFTDADVDGATKVCILGSTVADTLFLDEDPIGKVIRVRDMPLRVVGVLQERGQSPFGQNQDDTIYIPYTTVLKRVLNRTWLNFILVSAVSQARIDESVYQIEELLRQRHRIMPGQEDDFFVGTQYDLTTMATAAISILTILLGSVASISLVVGGIGIMNIMLVSVRERTREIGVRMAIGAKGKDIMLQFLIEAIVLSAIGGAIGIAFGITGANLVSKFIQIPTVISPVIIIIALLFSASIGIFFGFYPARIAAKLNPIEALRYE